eukprot:TRINITY_DN337_c0_g1_i1.p1 TRINITY_DN337_c0_g1~~TRINITY_DN337_c0_g1_i1.p1  ORF type:complete len:114 (-),score=9.15 TRINITY_DN337_c0_g1_i1:328-669(-)
MQLVWHPSCCGWTCFYVAVQLTALTPVLDVSTPSLLLMSLSRLARLRSCDLSVLPPAQIRFQLDLMDVVKAHTSGLLNKPRKVLEARRSGERAIVRAAGSRASAAHVCIASGS